MNLPALQLDTELFKNRVTRSFLPSLTRPNPLTSHSQDDATKNKNLHSSQTHLMHKTCFQLTATSKTVMPREVNKGFMRGKEQNDPLLDIRPNQFKVISRKKGILIKRRDPLSNRRSCANTDETQKTSLNYSTGQSEDGNREDLSVNYDDKDGSAYSAPIKKKAKKVTFLGSADILGDLSDNVAFRKTAGHSLFRPKSSEHKRKCEERPSAVDSKFEVQNESGDSKNFLSEPETDIKEKFLKPIESEPNLKIEKSYSSADGVTILAFSSPQTKDALKLQKPLISPMNFKKKEYNLTASNFFTPKSEESAPSSNQPSNRHTKSIISAQNVFVDQKVLKGISIFSNNTPKDMIHNINITAIISPKPKVVGASNAKKEQSNPYLFAKGDSKTKL